MFSLAKALGKVLRARWRTALVAVVLLAGAAVAGLDLLARHHFRAAQQALHDFHLAEARRHIHFCLRVWPRGVATHLLAARIERWSANYPEAAQLLETCQRLQGGTTEATQLEWFLLRAQSGELDEVEEVLGKSVLREHPETTEILATLARANLSEWRLGKGLEYLRRWLERDAQAPQAWYWRGWAWERLTHHEAALADYQRSLELDPDRPDVRLALVSLYLDHHKPTQAFPHLEKLARAQPDHPEVLEGLARCLVFRGEVEEARRLLDRVLVLQPDRATTLMLRGQLACEQGNAREGEVWLRKALALSPHDKDVLFQLGACLRQQKGREREAADFQARHDAIVADLIRLQALFGGPILRSSHNPDALAEVGTLLLRLGEDRAALEWLNRALEQDPGHRPAHEALARYFEEKGDREKAAEERRILARLGPAPGPARP